MDCVRIVKEQASHSSQEFLGGFGRMARLNNERVVRAKTVGAPRGSLALRHPERMRRNEVIILQGCCVGRNPDVGRWREFFRGSVQPRMCSVLALIGAKHVVQDGSLDALFLVCAGLDLFNSGACSNRGSV